MMVKADMDKLMTWSAVYAQPFFYGAITRLPFIYFVVDFDFELDWIKIGIFVGCYQFARVVTSVFSMFSPRLSQAAGTMVGLAGNVLVLLSDRDDKTRIILGTVLVGCSETLCSMQTYVKERWGSNLDDLEFKLKLQYAAVMLGVTFAFSFGGYLYHLFKMDGVALFGAVMSTAELISFFAYLRMERLAAKNSIDSSKSSFSTSVPCTAKNSHHTNSEEDPTGCSEEDHTEVPQETPTDLEECTASNDSGTDLVKFTLDSFSESAMGANYLSYFLAFSIGMEAITIGYNLAISPVYITEIFERNTTVIGILLAAGAGTGTILTIAITLTKQGRAVMDKLMPSPLNILIAMAGISVSVLIAAVPIFPVHIIGLLLLMTFNDLAALLLNEMQGAITSSKAYSRLAPMGQIIRRSGNVLTAVSGPVLFGLVPQLPYIVAGAITAAWTIVLVLVIRHRSKQNHKTVVESDQVPESISCFFLSASFSRKEVLARQVKKASTTSQETQADVETMP